MKKINMAQGLLILMGLVLLLNGIIIRLLGLNFLAPAINSPLGCFVVSNTCFLLAFVLEIFGDE